MTNSQFIAYDIQLFELSLDLVIIGAATCSAIITYTRYLLYGEMATMDSLKSVKHQQEGKCLREFNKIYRFILGITMILKIAVCIIGHSSVIMRNQYYPHPEEFRLAYAWIQFYFIEVLTFIPSTIFLAYQAIMEMEELPSFPKRPTADAI